MSNFNNASLICTPNAVKAGKLYSIKPTNGTGDLDVVRATSATRVNSAGLIESVGNNIARLDYTNASCPSILVEPQRTNLLSRSEEFDNASWEKSNATISANTTTAPDGTLTADKLVENANNSTHIASQTVNVVSNTVFTYSMFVKAAERNIVYLGGLGRMPNSSESYVWFNLNLGTVLSSVGGFTGSIQPLNNGWWKISVTAVASPTSTQREFRVGCSIAANIQAYKGDGTSGVYIWGAQLEAGANATSYIPTVASTVTRNADVISKTGISSLIGQTEGTIFINFNKTKNNLSLLSIDDGTTNNRIFLEGTDTSTGLRVRVTNGGTTTVDNTSNVLQNGINKIALVYANNNVSLYRNGVLIFNDNSATIPNTSILRIGSNVNNLFQLGDSINSAVLWKTALTDQQCIELTTL